MKESPAINSGMHGSALTDLSPTPYRLVPRTNPLVQAEEDSGTKNEHV